MSELNARWVGRQAYKLCDVMDVEGVCFGDETQTWISKEEVDVLRELAKAVGVDLRRPISHDPEVLRYFHCWRKLKKVDDDMD